MTYNVVELDKVFRQAGKSALYAWKQDESGLDDLVQDLWVWYLETPSTQKKISKIEPHEAVKTVKIRAMQLLSKAQLSSNEFHGRNLYSSESVKDALLGKSKNRYLADILPRALDALSDQNEGQAESIRSRYEDDVVPVENAPQQVLKRAVKSLTEHVNIIAITAGVDSEGNVSEGPGSRSAVFPETRKAQGYGHSDPTANIAIMLLENPVDEEGNPLRDEYLYEEPLPQFLGGRGE